MATCNLEMTNACYGCGYYAYVDTEGCELTIMFHKKYPNHTAKEYEQYMINNGRKKYETNKETN